MERWREKGLARVRRYASRMRSGVGTIDKLRRRATVNGRMFRLIEGDAAAPAEPACQFDIEKLALDLPLEGREGLDANHASRLRMQFLSTQHASLITQTQFADAKAAALMTVMALVALNGPVKILSSGNGNVAILIMFLLTILAIGTAMAAIMPRYPDSRLSQLIKRRDRFAWPGLVAQGYDPLDHARFMQTAEASQLIMSISHTNAAMARVLQVKFQYLRAAYLLAALDLALMVLQVTTASGPPQTEPSQ